MRRWHAGRRAAAAARPADRHQGPARTPRACARTYGSPLFRDHVPDAGRAAGRRGARGRRDRHRQDQHAGIRRRRQHPQCGLWRDRQPVRSDEVLRRVVGRLGGGAGDRHGAALPPAPIPAGRCAIPPRSAASSASARRPGLVPTERRGAWAGADLPVLGPMARTVAGYRACCSRPWSATMRCDPLADDGAWHGGARAGRFLPACADRSVRGCASR